MYEQENGELKHYGVLGMKWGVRRARKMAESANRSAKKGDRETAEKKRAKSKAILDKHKRLVGDEKTFNRLTKKKTGKLLLQSLLMGSYGALKYNQERANGKGRIYSNRHAQVDRAKNIASLGLRSVLEPRRSAKRREKNK